MLTSNQIIAAQLVGTNVPPEMITQEVGINIETFHQWLMDDEFQELVEDIRRQRVELNELEEVAYNEIFALKSLAAEKLKELMNSKDARVALKAAETVLNFGL